MFTPSTLNRTNMASSGLDEEKRISNLDDAAADIYIDRCQDASFRSNVFSFLKVPEVNIRNSCRAEDGS